MRVHANILDTILATPKNGNSVGSAKIASGEWGDLFMDTPTREFQHGRSAGNKQAAVGTDLLDAVADITKVGTLGGAKRSKTAADKESAEFYEIRSRDMRSISKVKTFEQACAKARPRETIVAVYENGQKRELGFMDGNAFRDTTHEKLAKAKSADLITDRDLSDSNACNWVKRLLNDGEKPADIDAKLEKMAVLEGFDKSIASEYLKDKSGVMGLAYIEPNAYMNDCVSTNDRINTKLGGTRAASVKQVAACPGCQYFNKTASAKDCNLYHLPIVSNKTELVQIIATLTPGAKDKKAALVTLANNVGVIAAPATKSSSFSRPEIKGAIIGTKGVGTSKTKKAASFDNITVLNLHNEGKNIKDIFAAGVQMVGAKGAETAIKSFIAHLKEGKTKIALSQIDCTLLGGKLSSSNAIHGAKKCGSCTFRQGMHCGLTGGTLLDFPGMATAKGAARQNHRTAGNTLDGAALVAEFDMTKRHDIGDIEILEDLAGDFELGDFGHMDL